MSTTIVSATYAQLADAPPFDVTTREASILQDFTRAEAIFPVPAQSVGSYAQLQVAGGGSGTGTQRGGSPNESTDETRLTWGRRAMFKAEIDAMVVEFRQKLEKFASDNRVQTTAVEHLNMPMPVKPTTLLRLRDAMKVLPELRQQKDDSQKEKKRINGSGTDSNCRKRKRQRNVAPEGSEIGIGDVGEHEDRQDGSEGQSGDEDTATEGDESGNDDEDENDNENASDEEP
ncbi:hypothetical protein D1P53_000569 [Cryptococcus gattii VGV]|nr:hypothetical protein D1P53_000569 [Cryptococcus gattii VGV]